MFIHMHIQYFDIQLSCDREKVTTQIIMVYIFTIQDLSAVNNYYIESRAYKLKKRACNAILHFETAKF